MKRLVSFALALACTWVLGCASSGPPFPAGHPLRGPHGSYELVPQTETWVRAPGNESKRNVDLSLEREGSDAWLNVSVLPNRYPTAQLALERGRSRVEGLMSVGHRTEEDLTVPSPEGDLEARLGVYCGTFYRELRARETCFVLLATRYRQNPYVLVGQVRVDDDPDGDGLFELMAFVKSFRITSRRTGAMP